MKLKRRDLLKGSAALAAFSSLPRDAEAWLHPGKQLIGTGWSVLPLGCGGFVIGMDIAQDRSVACRTDVGNAYVFSGTLDQLTDPTKTWLPLKTYASLGSSYSGSNGGYNGAYELVFAPNNSSNLYMIISTNGGTNSSWAVFYSLDKGNSFTQSAVIFGLPDGGSNGTWKVANRKIAVDPANPQVVYTGTGAANSASITGSIDNNSGSSGKILHVSAVTYGALYVGQTVWNGVTSLGTITSQAATHGGDISTWNIDTASLTASTSLIITWSATGDPSSVYRAINGVTFATIPSLGVSVNAPGVCGIIFDPSYGTTTVGGQTRTKRVIIPVGGVGIFESLDGGVTFTETAVTPMGRSDIAVTLSQVDANGVVYCLVNYASSTALSHVWRYGAAGGLGTGGGWIELSAQSGWVAGGGGGNYPGGIAVATSAVILADSRSGHNGFVTICGPNGAAVGFTSTNADLGTPSNPGSVSSVSWHGATGGETHTLSMPLYDCTWLDYVSTNPSAGYLQQGGMAITAAGECFWTGSQGALWKFTTSDLSTPQIPNWGSSLISYSVGTSRGTEVTVAQDAIDAPGAPQPVIAAQDVGIFQTSYAPGFYPTNFYPSPNRVDCETLEYAASDPSFYVGKVNTEVGIAPISGGAYAAYSPSYGATGSWVPYSVMPDLLWCASIVGSVSGGVLTVTSFNSVTGLGNVVLPGQVVYNVAGSTNYGTVEAYGTGGTSGTGGTGTYSVGGSSSIGAGTTMILAPITTGGQMVAVDADHHMCCITHNSGAFVPGYTATARGPSSGAGACAWNFCGGLPSRDWMNRGYNFGSTSRPFAVGYVTDLGTVWACEQNSGTATLWRSTDSGATFTSVVTWACSVAVAGGPFLLSVPGFPDELWVAFYNTGGSPLNVWHITAARTGSPPTVTPVGTPASNPFCHSLTLGLGPSPGSYPALYGVFNNSNGLGGQTIQEVFQGTYNTVAKTVSWALFAHPNGTNYDLPPVSQLAGFQSIRGSWNAYQRLLVPTGQSGFAYYNP